MNKEDRLKRNDLIKLLRHQGMTCKEIAGILDCTESNVSVIVKKYGIDVPVIKKCKCSICGNAFDVTVSRAKKRYCSEACRKIAERERLINRQKSSAYKTDDSGVQDMLNRCAPEWEYVGGYTGSTGSMVVRHICGFTTRWSSITMRHNSGSCWLCDYEKAKVRKEQIKAEKEKQREIARFYRKVPKYSQQKANVCKVCGSFFFDAKRKYCSEECVKSSRKHYDNMRKRKRYNSSWTEESKSITLDKLYERDGGICWICGGVCDKNAGPNSNNYPSVDHVIPIAHGGKDEWSNVRLAHRICNTLKGAKIIERASPVAIIEASCT